MQKIILKFSLLILPALVLTSCLIRSLNPFYHESDVIFDKTLIGSWNDQDSGLWSIEQFSYPLDLLGKDTIDNSYKVTYTDKNGIISVFNAHLFELEGNRYIDFYPLMSELYANEAFYSFHLLPVHTVAKLMRKDNDQIAFKWYNEDWFHELVTQNKTKTDYKELEKGETDVGFNYILTGSTTSLQDFLNAHGNDTNAFNQTWNQCAVDDNDEICCLYLSRRIK
jgi:hypothetical protein